jgi:hypothetical protein
MSSGEKILQVSPLERAVSADIIRAQSFIGAALNEMLRALGDTGQGFDDVNAGGLYLPNGSAGDPSSALVFAGLLLQPTGGSVASNVTGGTLGIYDPDATPSADDSQYKLITSSGTGALTLTPNSSGHLRIDVLECARVQPDAVVETDSRDVFNTTTGLFAAATVNKVTQSQLQFRIRLGTPSSGYPNNATGWLPLAVLSVPNGTTVWDTVTIWDVRPLAEDLAFGLSNVKKDLPRVTRCVAQVDTSGGTTSVLSGVVEGVLSGRRIGGMLRSSCLPPASDSDSNFYADIDNAQNQSAGGSIGTTGFNYVYLCAPFGLPRWARYTIGPNGRVPRSPRGILVASAQVPDLVYGTPHSNLILPPALQNGTNTAFCTESAAVCVLARIGTSGGSHLGSLVATGRKHWSGGFTATNDAVIATVSAGNLYTATFTLTPGTDFPAHARAVYLNLNLAYGVSGGTLSSFAISPPAVAIGATSGTVFPPGNSTTAWVPEGMPSLSGAEGPTYSNSQTIPLNGVVRIPAYNFYDEGIPGSATPGDSSTFALVLTASMVTTGAGALALTGANFNVVGWELSDAD